jgi:hypothetical protein
VAEYDKKDPVVVYIVGISAGWCNGEFVGYSPQHVTLLSPVCDGDEGGAKSASVP